jgi:hypothetical protein
VVGRDGLLLLGLRVRAIPVVSARRDLQVLLGVVPGVVLVAEVLVDDRVAPARLDLVERFLIDLERELVDLLRILVEPERELVAERRLAEIDVRGRAIDARLRGLAGRRLEGWGSRRT